MSEVSHACLAGRGCVSQVVEDGVKRPATTAGPSELCDGCAYVVERTIRELPETWVSLHTALGDRSRQPGQKVSGTSAKPISINIHADGLKVAISDWLCAAAARVAEKLNVDDPQPRSAADAEQARVVVACCKLLEPNVGKLLDSDADAVMVWRQQRDWDKDNEEWWQRDRLIPEDMSGIQIALELLRQHKLSRSLLGHTQPRIRQSLPCPICQGMTVYRLVRTVRGKVYDDVSCEGCSTNWDYLRYQQICNVALHAIEEERVTEDERIEAWLACERMWLQAQSAEWAAAKTSWQLSLLLDPAVAGLPVETFAREILGMEAA